MKQITKLKQLVQELNEALEAVNPSIEAEVQKQVAEFKHDARQDSSYREDVLDRAQWVKNIADNFEEEDQAQATALLNKIYDEEGFGDSNHIWCNDCDDDGVIENSSDRWVWTKSGEGYHTTDDSQSFCDCAVGRKLEDRYNDYD